MRRRTLAVATALACSAILLAGPVARSMRAAGDDDAKADGAKLFGLTRVVGLDIEISEDEYRAMQPPAPAGVPGAPPPPKRPGDRESERNLFGVEFPWVRGAVTAEGRTYKTVGLRYAGNASYMASAGGLKRSFVIDLDRFDHLDFRGLRAIPLQGGALDPTKAREALAYA